MPCLTESCVIPQNYVDPDLPSRAVVKTTKYARNPFSILSLKHDWTTSIRGTSIPCSIPKRRYGLGYQRTKPITDLKYFQTRLFNKDSMWHDVVGLFWALNTLEMRKLQNEISVVSCTKKQNPSGPQSTRNHPLTCCYWYRLHSIHKWDVMCCT